MEVLELFLSHSNKSFILANKNKIHCPKGHLYSDKNLIIEKKKNGKFCRRCRICKNENSTKSALKNRSKVYKYQKQYRIENVTHIKRYERNSTLKKRGMSIQEYNDILESQNFVCAICKNICSTDRHLAIDHSHETGKIRGLLCKKCNTGLGCFEDNISSLKEAINYLEKHTV